MICSVINSKWQCDSQILNLGEIARKEEAVPNSKPKIQPNKILKLLSLKRLRLLIYEYIKSKI